MSRSPLAISLLFASVVVSGRFVWVGEFWTSILRMIRVGSQHVGGRVGRLPWPQHAPQIFVGLTVVFWAVVLVRRVRRWGGRNHAGHRLVARRALACARHGIVITRSTPS